MHVNIRKKMKLCIFIIIYMLHILKPHFLYIINLKVNVSAGSQMLYIIIQVNFYHTYCVQEVYVFLVQYDMP